MSHSIVIIVPNALREAVNEAAEENGHGPNNMSVPLSSNGTEPATHYGCRTWASDGFLAELNDYPQQLKVASIIDIRPDAECHGHFDAVLAANNLQKVADES